VLHTIGAGDAFNAGFIRAVADGRDIQESMLFATATAALKISRPYMCPHIKMWLKSCERGRYAS